MKVGEKLYSFLRLRVEAMTYVCDVISKEDEKSRDNDVCMYNFIYRQNGNDCMCAVAIYTEVNIESNLQLESFSSLFKLLGVTALVY